MEQIRSPGGYFSRPIVDHVGNVLEGQHRTEAAKRLGVKNLPVHVIKDLAHGKPIEAIKEAVRAAGKLPSDHVHQIVQQALEMVDDSGSAAKAREEYDLAGTGFGKYFEAADQA
jgi:hypothetical protein